VVVLDGSEDRYCLVEPAVPGFGVRVGVGDDLDGLADADIGLVRRERVGSVEGYVRDVQVPDVLAGLFPADVEEGVFNVFRGGPGALEVPEVLDGGVQVPVEVLDELDSLDSACVHRA
jgi:hypothetical protein